MIDPRHLLGVMAQRREWSIEELAEALDCSVPALAPVARPLIDQRRILRVGRGLLGVSFDFLVELALERFPEGATSAQIIERARQVAGRDCLTLNQTGHSLRRLRAAGRVTKQGRTYHLAPFAPSSAPASHPPRAALGQKGTSPRPGRMDWSAHLDGPHDLRTTLAVWMERAGLDDDTKARLWADLEGAPA